MKKLFFLVLFVSAATIMMGQSNSFLIYSMKGNITSIDNKVESKVKIGKLLGVNNTIKVPAGGTVTLICNEIAMFTLKKPGVYQLSQLGDSCAVSKSSVSSNYLKYVWAQMTKSTAAPGSNRKMYMNTVGAVSRSINNIWIDPRLDTVNYAGGDFPLSWKSYAEAKEFAFLMYNNADGGKPFYTTTVDKLKISIPKIIGGLKPGNTYYWTAAIKGEENNDIKVFNYVTRETLDKIIQDLKAAGPVGEGEAEQAYRLAFMLEDMHYLADALSFYAKAATLRPDSPLYRSTLMSFKKDYEIK